MQMWMVEAYWIFDQVVSQLVSSQTIFISLVACLRINANMHTCDALSYTQHTYLMCIYHLV